MQQNLQVYQSKSNFKKYYEIGKIGKGSQGHVIKVLDDYSNVYALKKQLDVRKYEKAFLDEIIKINEENRFKLIKKLKQEQNEMSQLDPIQLQYNNNQNKLLQIYEHFKIEDCQVELYCTVSEYCNGGNLQAELKEKKNYNLNETANIIIDICKQLEIIHSMNYIVLDLKPANIVIQKSNQRYKIFDFGSILFCNGNQENPTDTQSRCITPCYEAPELCEGGVITKKVDIWALGIIMFELLKGEKPFNGYNYKEKIINYQKNENNQQNKISDYFKKIIKDQEIRELLQQMLEPKPELRCDLKKIQEVQKPKKISNLGKYIQITDISSKTYTQDQYSMKLSNQQFQNDQHMNAQLEQLIKFLQEQSEQIENFYPKNVKLNFNEIINQVNFQQMALLNQFEVKMQQSILQFKKILQVKDQQQGAKSKENQTIKQWLKSWLFKSSNENKHPITTSQQSYELSKVKEDTIKFIEQMSFDNLNVIGMLISLLRLQISFQFKEQYKQVKSLTVNQAILNFKHQVNRNKALLTEKFHHINFQQQLMKRNQQLDQINKKSFQISQLETGEQNNQIPRNAKLLNQRDSDQSLYPNITLLQNFKKYYYIDQLNLCKEQIEKHLHWVEEGKQFFQQNKILDYIALKYNQLLKEIQSINKLEEEIFLKINLNQLSNEELNQFYCCFPSTQQKTGNQKEIKKSGLYERICQQFVGILNISVKLTFSYQCIFYNLSQQIKNISENNFGSETNKKKLEKNFEVNPIAFLLSWRKNDKSFIMSSLYPNEKTQFYQKYSQSDLGIDIIDTEPFEFEVIDKWENQIKQYQKIFRDNSISYCCLWVVIKFERLDIMKSYFMSIYKFVINFEVPIFMIVTDFHLSENKKQDNEDIRQKFRSFELNQIIFVEQHMAKSDLTLELRKAILNYQQKRNNIC